MAIVTESQQSFIANLAIDAISGINFDTESEGILKIENYLQDLKRQYNKKILKKCLGLVVNTLDDMYYNDGTSPWSDLQYDCFIECLKSEGDYNGELVDESGVGAQVNSGYNTPASTKLPYFMASMNKYKTIGEINNWCHKFRGPYTVTAKLDGVSAMYYKGKLYTRGNGISGRNISYLIPFLKQNNSMASALDGDYEFGLRGELIIRKSVFTEKYCSAFANSRNLVCGLLNRLYSEENEEFYKDIDFVVYDVYHYNPLQFCNKIKIIRDSSCSIVQYKDKIGSDYLENLEFLNFVLTKWKTEYDYEIDGIIVTNNKPCIHSNDSNPDFAFAYKNNILGVEMKEAIVDKVLWNVSKDNYLKPKIKLTQKTQCNGSQVEYVTGFNAKYILQNNIKYGTVVKIGLSGNVIPHIFEIVNSDGKLPQSLWEDLTHLTTQKLLENIGLDNSLYGWSKNKVDLVSTNSDNYACTIKKNMILFQSFDIKCGLQETTLLNLYNSIGVYKLQDVLDLTVEQWEQVDKVGTKKGQKIVMALKESIDWTLVKHKPNISEEYFMKWLLGLQCFPRGFGKKKLESHVQYVKQVCKFDVRLEFSENYDPNYFENMTKIIVNKTEEFKTPQVTNDSIVLFCKGFSNFIHTYDLIQSIITIIELPTLKTLMRNMTENEGDVEGGAGGGTNPCENGNIVFSGVRDKEKEKYYMNQGYEISDSVNSKTKLLIVKDKNAQTTKIKRAQSLGIKIASLNEL